jgi:integrase
MPPTQRGQAYRLAPNRWGLRYYDVDGNRRRKSPFPSRSSALTYYREVIEPRLRGEAPAPKLTLAEFIPIYLERHGPSVRPKTQVELRNRLGYAVKAFGDVSLRDFERMGSEVAKWRTTLPERSRYDITRALRQACDAAVRWGHTQRNPARDAGRNPQPPPRPIRAYAWPELEAIAVEMSPVYRPLPLFAAATGLRPQEWAALEHRDIDRRAEVPMLTVQRTISSGEVLALAKTERSHRQVPLSDRAIEALDALPRRLDVPFVFPAKRGGVLNLDHFRQREWAPAIEAAGIKRPARMYDTRSTFASNALDAGVSVFQLARVMGTSIAMIERCYGTLLDGSGADIARRLNAVETRVSVAAENV